MMKTPYKRTLYVNPVPTVNTIITRSRHLLCLQRPIGRPKAGKWCLPSGFLELHESFEVAAKRECLEETGLTVDNLTLAAAYSHLWIDGRHVVGVIFITDDFRGTITRNEESAAAIWFSFDDLPEFDSPELGTIIEEVCNDYA